LQLGDDLGRSLKLALGQEGVGKQHQWWLHHWENFAHSGRAAELHTLPRQRSDFSVLPEAKWLQPLIFGSNKAGQRRMAIAQSVAASGACDHESLFQHLSQRFNSNPTIARLAPFARLADAGLDAMNHLNSAIKNEPKVALADVARGNAAKEVCAALAAAARDWLAVQAGAAAQAPALRHADAADRFAQTMTVKAAPQECFSRLLCHHETYGGGSRWFVLRDRYVEARTVSNGEASRYGFRLWALCRLAMQCGVLSSMSKALGDDVELDDDEDDAR